MIRFETLPLDTVFNRYETVMDNNSHHQKTVANLSGYDLKFSSHRLWTFYEHGTTCELCGLKADFFAIEKNHDGEARPHLNLYADTPDGEILFTKDHIHPQSKGGNNHINNYQTLCKPCNEQKDDTV